MSLAEGGQKVPAPATFVPEENTRPADFRSQLIPATGSPELF
jgi:hypothetical protein